jgi:hypothetical protein
MDNKTLERDLLPNEDEDSRQDVDEDSHNEEDSQMEDDDDFQMDGVTGFLMDLDDDDDSLMDESLGRSNHDHEGVARGMGSLLNLPQDIREVLFNGPTGIELAENWIKQYLRRNEHLNGKVADQSSIRLLQLPQELRDQVYKHLFWSTRLTFGKRYFLPEKHQKFVANTRKIEYMIKWLKPAPNSLAILRTCRQTYSEATNRWVGEVLFNFERAEDMLDKLDSLSPSTIASIRHLRVCDTNFWVAPPKN